MRGVALSVVLAGGMIPEPLDVLTVGLVNGRVGRPLDWGLGPWIRPFVNLGVTIREGKTAGPIVITGRAIGHGGLGEIGVADHIDDQ